MLIFSTPCAKEHYVFFAVQATAFNELSVLLCEYSESVRVAAAAPERVIRVFVD